MENKVLQFQNRKKNNKSFVDISVKGTHTWPHYWDEYLEKWATKCGAITFNDIIYNRKYHIWYLGLKVLNIEVNDIRGSIRNRPSSITDKLMLMNIVDFGVYIPSIPLSYIDYKKKKYLSDANIKKAIQDGYIETKDELYKPLKINRNDWLHTIQSYCIRRYDKELSIEWLNKQIPHCVAMWNLFI